MSIYPSIYQGGGASGNGADPLRALDSWVSMSEIVLVQSAGLGVFVASLVPGRLRKFVVWAGG